MATATPSRGENSSPQIPPSLPLLSWSAPSDAQHERSKRWYIGAGVTALLCVLYSILTAAWTFVIVLVPAVVLYWWLHRNPPPDRSIAIFQEGVAFEKDFLPWEELTGFWILVGDGYEELHIERVRRILGTIRIRTGDTDPYEIRDVLSPLLPELRDRKERLVDRIIRICKL